MDSSVSRDDISDLVQRFLESGGSVESIPPKQPSTHKASEPGKRLGICKDKRSEIADPLSQPISLKERALLPEVQRCITEGMLLTEIMKELKASRSSILRVVHEYELTLPKSKPRFGERKSDDEVLKAVLAGLQQGRSLYAICTDIGVKGDRGMDLYLKYKRRHPDAPRLTSGKGHVSTHTDAEVLALVLAGLEVGRRPRQSCARAGVGQNRGMRLYRQHLSSQNEL